MLMVNQPRKLMSLNNTEWMKASAWRFGRGAGGLQVEAREARGSRRGWDRARGRARHRRRRRFFKIQKMFVVFQTFRVFDFQTLQTCGIWKILNCWKYVKFIFCFQYFHQRKCLFSRWKTYSVRWQHWMGCGGKTLFLYVFIMSDTIVMIFEIFCIVGLIFLA